MGPRGSKNFFYISRCTPTLIEIDAQIASDRKYLQADCHRSSRDHNIGTLCYSAVVGEMLFPRCCSGIYNVHVNEKSVNGVCTIVIGDA